MSRKASLFDRSSFTQPDRVESLNSSRVQVAGVNQPVRTNQHLNMMDRAARISQLNSLKTKVHLLAGKGHTKPEEPNKLLGDDDTLGRSHFD